MSITLSFILIVLDSFQFVLEYIYVKTGWYSYFVTKKVCKYQSTSMYTQS